MTFVPHHSVSTATLVSTCFLAIRTHIISHLASRTLISCNPCLFCQGGILSASCLSPPIISLINGVPVFHHSWPSSFYNSSHRFHTTPIFSVSVVSQPTPSRFSILRPLLQQASSLHTLPLVFPGAASFLTSCNTPTICSPPLSFSTAALCPLP